MKTRFGAALSLVIALSVSACGGGGAGSNGGAKSPGEDTATEGGGESKPLVAPAPGVKSLEHRSVSLDYELVLARGDAAGGMQAGSWSLEEERSQEVLASEGPAVTKLKVVYGRREAKPLLGVEQTAATAGHTYELERKAGELSLTRADGKDVSAAERDALEAEYAWVGGPSTLAEWLKGGSLAEGKSVEGGSAEARALLGVLSGVDYANAKVSAVSRGKKGNDLSLHVKASLRLTSGETHFDLTLEGPAVVDTTSGWVKSLALAGPVKAGGKYKHKKGLLDVSGKGKAKLDRKAL